MERLNVEYTSAKKTLKKNILEFKKRTWDELCRVLDEDVWGDGYKIATRKIKRAKVPYILGPDRKDIVKALFPVSKEGVNTSRTRDLGNHKDEDLSGEELRRAIKKFKAKKASGPVGRSKDFLENGRRRGLCSFRSP